MGSRQLSRGQRTWFALVALAALIAGIGLVITGVVTGIENAAAPDATIDVHIPDRIPGDQTVAWPAWAGIALYIVLGIALGGIGIGAFIGLREDRERAEKRVRRARRRAVNKTTDTTE